MEHQTTARPWVRPLVVAALSTLPLVAMAATDGATTDATTIAGLADNLSNQFTSVGKLMIGTAYVAGIGFGIASIFKFKQHKDNPTQVPIGTPFALLAVSVLLVFLPGLYKPAGQSIFGTTKVAGGFSGGGQSALPQGAGSSGGSSSGGGAAS